MTNADRIEIGRQLLELTRSLQCEGGIGEDTARDAICDILHAVLHDHLLIDHDPATLVLSCVDHVSEELREPKEKEAEE